MKYTRYTCAHTHSHVHTHLRSTVALQWHHDDLDDVSNHQPHGCLLNRLFRRRSKKTAKLRVIGLSAGNSPGPVNSPHKGPVTRKMLPFDDVIMVYKTTGRSFMKISEIRIEIQNASFRKMHLKMFAKWWPFYPWKGELKALTAILAPPVTLASFTRKSNFNIAVHSRKTTKVYICCKYAKTAPKTYCWLRPKPSRHDPFL